MAAQATTLQEVARAAALGVALQVALGAPFLAAAPGAYVGRAFELSRAFLHTWSVNLKFLPERLFLSPALAAGLLAAHLALLWLFAEYRRAALHEGSFEIFRGPMRPGCWSQTWHCCGCLPSLQAHPSSLIPNPLHSIRRCIPLRFMEA